jgi:peptidoglycan/xylan/chitin deacetylase (PgdA/CDA1 family)
VITGRVGTGNIAVNGNWSDFTTLQGAGHAIQSHTVDHYPLPAPSYSPLTLETNYSQAITDIETHVAGSDVLTIAYPNGLVAPNDKTVAAQHYIAARGVTGELNKLVGIDYFNVKSLSTDAYATNGFQYPGHDVGRPWADPSQLLTVGHQYYKGWFSVHSHGMNTDKKNAITGLLGYMTTQPNGYWFGTFAEVAQYARERDTASLATSVISPEEIQYTLTDTLDGTKFYEPLTVKVRVDNTWTQIVAMQNGQTLSASLIMDGGEQYALVNSVPDTGAVSLREFLPPTADFDVDGDVDGVDFLAWQRGFGTSPGATLAQGDADHDGAVTAADLAIWQNHYGTALTAATLAVPEPASAILLLVGIVLWQLLGNG